MCMSRIAQIPLGSSRHVSTRHDTYERVERVVTSVEPCLFQHGGRRRSSSACVYKFRLLCSGFASISGTISGKSEVDDMSTTVHAVVTPLNTCRASRACREERIAPCCPTIATRLVTFPHAKMHGLGSVLWRAWRAKWNLGLNLYVYVTLCAETASTGGKDYSIQYHVHICRSIW